MSSAPAASPPRVLLVDDNDAMLLRASAVLRASCVVVGTVRDGRAAVEAAARLLPDVIVLDISMPEMNGFAVAASLRAAGSTAAVIFLTVHEEEEFVHAAHAAGAAGYVVKARLRTDLAVAVHEGHAGRAFFSPRG